MNELLEVIVVSILKMNGWTLNFKQSNSALMQTYSYFLLEQ